MSRSKASETAAPPRGLRLGSRPTLRVEFSRAGAALVHLGLFAACVWTGSHGWWLAIVPLWIALAWMNHAALTRLHEASHGTLNKKTWLNELNGVLIGTVALTPLSVYRYIHAQHHAHIGKKIDPEFWPYTDPDVPRWRRVMHAWVELLLGAIATPVLYWSRTIRAWETLKPGQRRRIVLEGELLVVFWAAVLIVVAVNGWWRELLIAHAVPALLTGMAQSGRKFVEHMGLTGDSMLAMTRTVVYRRPLGVFASRTQEHVDHHGAHHRWARIPGYNLPEATRLVYSKGDEGPVFPNHLAATLDMLPHLLNPKVGPQWRERETIAS